MGVLWQIFFNIFLLILFLSGGQVYGANCPDGSEVPNPDDTYLQISGQTTTEFYREYCLSRGGSPLNPNNSTSNSNTETHRKRNQPNEVESQDNNNTTTYPTVLNGFTNAQLACQRAVDEALTSCSPHNSFSNAATNTINQIGAAAADSHQAAVAQCRALKMQAAAGIAVTQGLAYYCTSSIKSCRSQCNESQIKCDVPADGNNAAALVNYTECKRAKEQMQADRRRCEGATQQMLAASVLGTNQSATYYAQAKACDDLLRAEARAAQNTNTMQTNICQTPQGISTPGCPGYRQNTFAQGCAYSNPQARNNPECRSLYCPNHPEDKITCGNKNTQAVVPPAGGSRPQIKPSKPATRLIASFGLIPVPSFVDGPLDAPADEKNHTEKAAPTTATANSKLTYTGNDAPASNGAAGSAAGSNSLSASNNNPTLQGAPNKNWEPGGGYIGAQNMNGTQDSAVPVPSNLNGNSNGYSFDFSKFLPEPAEATGKTSPSEIAKANAVSNWERVSRKITQKRATLLPGQANQN